MDPWYFRLRHFWRRLVVELFEEDGLAAVFTHARNVLTGTALIAAGLYAARHFEKAGLPGMWKVNFAGYSVAALGVGLLLLNLLDGLRRLARRQHPMTLRVLAILAYLALSIRLTQVIVYFRVIP
jgi:hypothetical protein